jgi:hypothetical protein
MHKTNFVCPKFEIQFSKEALTIIVATRRLSNLASSFENNPPRGGRICTGMRGLSKQHDKNTIEIEMITLSSVFDNKQ